MISKENDFTLPITIRIQDGRRLFFAVGAIVFLALLVYSNSFNCVFQFDDTGNIVGNPNIEMKSLGWTEIKKTFHGIPGVHHGISRPLAYLSFALNYYFGELNVFGYHLVNFIIHVFTGIFFFLWIRLALNLPILFSRYSHAAYSIALLAAAIWVVHPIQVTAVTYIVQRMASMAAMFYVMALYFYLRGRVSQRKGTRIGWFAGCAIASIFAFATKENTVVLPLTFFIFDLLLIQGVRKQTVIWAIKWVVLPITAAALIALFYQSPAKIFSGYQFRSFTPTERFLTEHRILWQYIWWMVYPTTDNLSLFHDINLSTSLLAPWTTLPAVFSIYGAIGVAICISNKSPLISFLILFFFINHAIESTIIPLELIFEHRNYLPSMAIMLLFSICITDVLNFFRFKKLILGLIALAVSMIIAANGHTTYYRNDYFKNELFFLLDNIAKAPNLARQYNNLGKYYNDRGMYVEASEAYQKAIDLNRMELSTQKILYYENLGFSFFLRNDFETASRVFEEGLLLSKTGPTPKLLWGTALVHWQIGRRHKALGLMDQALNLDVNDKEILLSKALLLLEDTRVEESKKIALDLVRKNPAWVNGFGLLGKICMIENRPNLAIYYWREVQRLKPQRLDAMMALAELYCQTDDKTNAIAQMTKIMEFSKGIALSTVVERASSSFMEIHRPGWRNLESVYATISSWILRQDE